MSADLVRLARDGDRMAFEALAESNLDRLYATAALILHDRTLAEDAVQETLIRAWRSLPRLRDPERYEPWLQRVLVHACIDVARGERHRRTEQELARLQKPAPRRPSSRRASASPTGSPDVTPSPTVEPTSTARATPTPIVFPSAYPSPTPTTVGPAGTLTFRLTLQSLPPGTERSGSSSGSPMTCRWSLRRRMPQAPDGTDYTLCGRATTEPCSARRTYEQAFSGFEPNGLIYYDLAASAASGGMWHLATAQLPASGYLVTATYPAPDPTGPRGSCVGDLPNHPRNRRPRGVSELWAVHRD